jgi:DNA-binding CsgD family transcriptional regulator
MGPGDAAERIRREIVRLCHEGHDSRTLRSEALRRLRAAVPFEASFFATADPATLLYTGAVREGISPQATPRFVENELLQDDVNKFARLARGRQAVSTLGAATEGELERSPRYREILAPLGFGDELRVAVRTGGACWGYICLQRERTSPAFAASEARYLAALAPHLATGLRMALLLGGVPAESESDEPGVLVLADDGSVVATTSVAERWLAEVASEDWPAGDGLPRAVRSVAARARALEGMGQVDPSLMPRARLRTRAGRWLVVHASRLSGAVRDGRTAVVLEPARPAELAPLILQAYGLTGREAEVVKQSLRGLSTDEIAVELIVSPMTVQQHLKAVFDKVGVRSRRELTARIFSEHYRPGFVTGVSAAGQA